MSDDSWLVRNSCCLSDGFLEVFSGIDKNLGASHGVAGIEHVESNNRIWAQ